jgi:DNA helicase-2/ATP-dependent DNA helicase PcrA
MVDHSWFSELDDAQLAAVEHDSTPLIIAAGAGTGKTRTLTARVARLLESGVAPERILLLTFTRRAAAAMTTRAAALCADPAAAQRMWGGTFHAVAHRIVAEHAQHLGLSDVTVLDPNDVVDLLDIMREEHGLTGTQRRLPTTQSIADVYSRAANTGRPTRELMAELFPWCLDHADEINALLRGYVARKRERGLLDFDDLLLYWRALLADQNTGARLRARWDWVLVDEYQDVNRIQVDIVRLLREDGEGLTVVGDDAQAVYGFRGASADHLLDLHAQLPGATLLRLERNFRSTQPVLDLANIVRPGELRLQLTAHRGDRGARPVLMRCANADDEARSIADAVLAAHQDGLALREQAVLMRAGSHSNQLEIELKVRSVPFRKYGGIDYVNTAHVRDFVAALRVATNPSDEISWYRVLTRHRAIGKAHARALASMLVGADAADHPEVIAAAPPKARSALQNTLRLLGDAQRHAPAAGIVAPCHEAMRPLVRAHYADWARRADDVDRLAETAARQRDLRVFVAELTIDPASAAADYAHKPHLDEDYLTLSTVHSAKGLEWTAVHVLRAADGAFPSDMALTSDDGLAEEQRLFYVAITRARDTLRIYAPTRLPTHPTSFGARHVITKPSRFLTDQACAVMDVVEPTTQPIERDRIPVTTTVTVPALDDLFA